MRERRASRYQMALAQFGTTHSLHHFRRAESPCCSSSGPVHGIPASSLQQLLKRVQQLATRGKFRACALRQLQHTYVCVQVCGSSPILIATTKLRCARGRLELIRVDRSHVSLP